MIPGAAVLALLLSGCPSETGGGGGSGGSTTTPTGSSNCAKTVEPGDDDQKTVQTALIEVKEGEVLCFAAGTFKFTTELSLDVANVTLLGAGRDDTIWDFSQQDTGANGLVIKSNGVTVESLTVLNTPGDGIRGDSVEGITFRKVGVVWEVESGPDNGAYGLYPVDSSDVVIEQCKVTGARDAGVYVGQSHDILITDNEVFGNVAGIELENSTDAEVSNNHTYDNTAGILVFNLPNLPVQDGKRAKVHDNIVEKNNRKNFGEAGSVVSKVPVGIGIMILSSDDNEIHANDVKDNRNAGVVVVSYLATLFGPYDDPMFNPYPEGNFIHDNTFANNGTDPVGPIAFAFPGMNPTPDIQWDGCVDAMAVDDGHLVNCLMNNTGGGGPATYGNADLCNATPMVSTDAGPVTCEYDPLPPKG